MFINKALLFASVVVLTIQSLPVVAQVATRVAVMRHGRFVETGDVDLVLSRPTEEYTKELLAAVPELPR